LGATSRHERKEPHDPETVAPDHNLTIIASKYQISSSGSMRPSSREGCPGGYRIRATPRHSILEGNGFCAILVMHALPADIGTRPPEDRQRHVTMQTGFSELYTRRLVPCSRTATRISASQAFTRRVGAILNRSSKPLYGCCRTAQRNEVPLSPSGNS
jgi:hypothetical protein